MSLLQVPILCSLEKKKADRVRFWYDSSGTRFRYKFGYSALKDRSVEQKNRGWNPKYMVRLCQEGIRESSDPKCMKERHFWFALGQD